MRFESVVSLTGLALLLVLAMAHPAAADSVRIPGTKVSLVPPPEFTLSTQFPGVQHAERSSSIMVSELPAPVAEFERGLTKEALLSQGMTFSASEEITLSGRPGLLVSVTQPFNGATFEKWLGILGDTSSTVLVVATYPQPLEKELRQAMRSAILSVSWDPSMELDPFDGLSFRIQESEHLKIQNRIQNMLLLSAPGRNPNSPTEPFAVVGSSYNPVEIGDLEQFARQRIAQTAQITNLDEIKGEKIDIAGREAYEITARAKDQKTGASLFVYQCLLVVDDTYYMVQGMVGETQFNEYLPQFKGLARSLEIR